MGDDYSTWTVSNEVIDEYLEAWKRLKEREKEEQEYKAVFTDLEALESSINQAGRYTWPEPKKLTFSWSGNTTAFKYEDLINLIAADSSASYTNTTVSYNNISRFHYYDYSFEDSF